MSVKTVKISYEDHRLLKISAAQYGCSIQDYITLILEFALSTNPVIIHIREDYIRRKEEP